MAGTKIGNLTDMGTGPDSADVLVIVDTSANVTKKLSVGDFRLSVPRGYVGSFGYTGSQGDIGYTGSQGLIGYTGSFGDTGYTGSFGDTGFTGSQGLIGYTGSIGDSGSFGFTGSVGFVGSQGTPGGYTGSVGNLGFTGSVGTAGTNGTNGTDGYTGSKGDQGDIGYTGSSTGSTGLDSAAVGALIDSDLQNQTILDIGNSALGIAIGASVTTSNYATAVGHSASASGTGMVALGYSAAASGSSGTIAIGDASSTNTGSVAIGNASNAAGASAVSIGYQAASPLSGAGEQIAIGKLANAATSWDIAIGSNADANGGQSVAIGQGATTANLSIALGYNAETTAANGIAVGYNSSVTTQYGIDIRTSDSGSISYSTAADFVLGSGLTASNFVKSGATSDDVLLGDGTTTSLSGIGGGISNVVEDTTPQLGGTLQSNGQAISFADNDELQFGSGTGGDWVMDFNATNLVLNQDIAGDFIITNAADATQFWFKMDSGTFHAEGDLVGFSTSISSDPILKDNIQPLENSLDRVLELNGVSWNWKKDGSASAGVISTDVKKVLPEAVRTRTDFTGTLQYETVNYNAIIGLLVESIKDLQRQIDELKGQ